MKINTPISAGEIADKITILEIKSLMIREEDKLKEVLNEKTQLTDIMNDLLYPSSKLKFSIAQFFGLKADLYEINLALN